jgi:hypothetical protein
MTAPPRAAHKAVIVLATLCALLAVLCTHYRRLAERATGSSAPPAAQHAAPALAAADRDAAVAELVAAGGGLWDSHPDPLVARVLQPNLSGREDQGHAVLGNTAGMREREFTLPKPEGTLRVVLLGDSFIYGMGVAAEERLGVHLQRLLTEAAAAGGEAGGAADRARPPIEVLHLGVTSWSLLAETAFLRRQLGLLQPDLVVHHIVPNDLDDTAGVRGFGSPGRLVPAHPEQADALVSFTHGRFALHGEARGLLPWGLDAESRARLAGTAAEVERLAAAVRAAGGRYLLLINWNAYQIVAGRTYATRLPPQAVAYLPWTFYDDARFRISPADEHWNPAGHARVALYLHGLILERGLLPALALAPHAEALALARELDGAGRAEAARPDFFDKQIARQGIGPAIDASAWTADSAGQVYAGIDKDGLLAPRASVLLARAGGGTLHLVGRCLQRPELDGATLTVLVEGEAALRLPLAAGRAVDERVPLPAAARARPYLNVRLVADDFVYTGAGLRQCVSFQLDRLAIAP